LVFILAPVRFPTTTGAFLFNLNKTMESKSHLVWWLKVEANARYQLLKKYGFKIATDKLINKMYKKEVLWLK
jgi:hypothetical protein